MIEEEPICELVELLGDCLHFTDFEINGILKLKNENLISVISTPYDSETQEIQIASLTEDIVKNDIKKDDAFYVEDSTYRYNFTVAENPIPDFSGLSFFRISYVSKEVL